LAPILLGFAQCFPIFPMYLPMITLLPPPKFSDHDLNIFYKDLQAV